MTAFSKKRWKLWKQKADGEDVGRIQNFRKMRMTAETLSAENLNTRSLSINSKGKCAFLHFPAQIFTLKSQTCVFCGEVPLRQLYRPSCRAKKKKTSREAAASAENTGFHILTKISRDIAASVGKVCTVFSEKVNSSSYDWEKWRYELSFWLKWFVSAAIWLSCKEALFINKIKGDNMERLKEFCLNIKQYHELF